jgi:hypothetical protein
MKKIFAIALVGLFAVAFTDNANANAFDTDNDIVFTVGEYDAPADVITFEVVPVTTDFVEYVAVETVNYTNLGGFLADAVPIDTWDSTTNLTLNNSNAFADVPIDYGICSTNEFELTEPVPDLTEYVKEYNLTYGYAEPELVRDIATNVGKLTKFTLNL